MMPLRLIGLCGCAFALSGCHTIDAARRIARPSPVTAVSVEPSQDRVAWLAEYREPPGHRDPLLHRIFARAVTKRGHLDVDPNSTCVAGAEGDDAPSEPLRGREILLAAHAYVPVREAPDPQTSGTCETQLRLRLSGKEPYREAEAILVHNSSAKPLFEATFPGERPMLDPRRWGWLLVAPALDVGTIAVGIPFAGIVALFESLIIVMGPLHIKNIPFPVLVLTTTAENGTSKDRVLVPMESNGQIFVSTNHWPRAWFRRASKPPNVQVTLKGAKADYLAVPASKEENVLLDAEHPMPGVIRALTGFPPRSFLRLEPR